MSQSPPLVLPDDASIYMFSYSKSPVPLARRLAEVAVRATTKFGHAPSALVVPSGEMADYAAAQELDEEVALIPLLASLHLAADRVGAIDGAGRA